MKEFDDLLEALEAWDNWLRDGMPETSKCLASSIRCEYHRYKAAEPPLVLEVLPCDQVVSRIPVTKGYCIEWMGQCYKLPKDKP